MKRRIFALGLAACLFFQSTGITTLAAEMQAVETPEVKVLEMEEQETEPVVETETPVEDTEPEKNAQGGGTAHNFPSRGGSRDTDGSFRSRKFK